MVAVVINGLYSVEQAERVVKEIREKTGWHGYIDKEIS